MPQWTFSVRLATDLQLPIAKENTMKKFIVTTLIALLLATAFASARAEDAASGGACPGQKRRDAVLRFGATALQQSGCFNVIDRLALASLLREQELALTGIVAKESAVRVGRLSGAQIL